MTSSLSGEILRFSNSSFRIVSNSALADSKSKSSLNWVGGADLPPVLKFLIIILIKIPKCYLILVVSIREISLVILIGAAIIIILSIALVIVASIALT